MATQDEIEDRLEELRLAIVHAELAVERLLIAAQDDEYLRRDILAARPMILKARRAVWWILDRFYCLPDGAFEELDDEIREAESKAVS